MLTNALKMHCHLYSLLIHGQARTGDRVLVKSGEITGRNQTSWGNRGKDDTKQNSGDANNSTDSSNSKDNNNSKVASHTGDASSDNSNSSVASNKRGAS